MLLSKAVLCDEGLLTTSAKLSVSLDYDPGGIGCREPFPTFVRHDLVLSFPWLLKLGNEFVHDSRDYPSIHATIECHPRWHRALSAPANARCILFSHRIARDGNHIGTLPRGV